MTVFLSGGFVATARTQLFDPIVTTFLHLVAVQVITLLYTRVCVEFFVS